MGHIVLRQWQDWPPEPKFWRTLAAVVSVTGVQDAGLGVEFGPQSPDINALPLITRNKHKLT